MSHTCVYIIYYWLQNISQQENRAVRVLTVRKILNMQRLFVHKDHVLACNCDVSFLGTEGLDIMDRPKTRGN